METSTSSRLLSRRDRRLWLFPRFTETLPVEFYRWVGRVRVIVLVIFLVINFAAGIDLAGAGYRADFYWTGMAVNTPIVLTSILLGLVMWRARLSVPTLRRMTVACLLLDVASTTLLLWAHGTTSSHILMFGIFLVFIYRVAFDFSTGLIAVTTLLASHWGLFIAESQGWLATQPLLIESSQQLLFLPRQFGVMMVVSVFLVTSFVAADLTVARLHSKELAVRFLRETLAASEPGRVGRHTGRNLKQTYLVGSLIAAGGMGEVYRGHHERTKRKVAIKILHPHLMDDEMLLLRFRREAEITGQLGSANIVEVIDIDRDDDVVFLVLELLHGEDLKSRIDKQGQLPLDKVADVIGQVSEGLTVAHQANVVHRDLKPENIFLCDGRQGEIAKILDFGVSKIRGNATAITQEVALLGTPDFMSPEQAMGQAAQIDARTDVFALGCIAYTALTSHRPFSASSIPALLRRICDEEPFPLAHWRSDVPALVEEVLTIAMAKRVDERYATVAEFWHDLSAALAGKSRPDVSARAAAVHRGASATTTAVGEPGLDAAADTVAAGSGNDPTIASG